MPKIVFTDASVVINSVDLSDDVESVTINYEAEIQDTTSMGDDTRTKLSGLKNWTVDVSFFQDFDASQVDATLFSLVGAAAFPVAIKPTSGSPSATNPNFNGNALLRSYPPIAGAIGEVHKVGVSLEGTGTLTRSTS